MYSTVYRAHVETYCSEKHPSRHHCSVTVRRAPGSSDARAGWVSPPCLQTPCLSCSPRIWERLGLPVLLLYRISSVRTQAVDSGSSDGPKQSNRKPGKDPPFQMSLRASMVHGEVRMPALTRVWGSRFPGSWMTLRGSGPVEEVTADAVATARERDVDLHT